MKIQRWLTFRSPLILGPKHLRHIQPTHTPLFESHGRWGDHKPQVKTCFYWVHRGVFVVSLLCVSVAWLLFTDRCGMMLAGGASKPSGKPKLWCFVARFFTLIICSKWWLDLSSWCLVRWLMEILTDILACGKASCFMLVLWFEKLWHSKHLRPQHMFLPVFPTKPSYWRKDSGHLWTCFNWISNGGVNHYSFMHVCKACFVHKILFSSCHKRTTSPACLAEESYELLFFITASQNSEDVCSLRICGQHLQPPTTVRGDPLSIPGGIEQ